METTWRQFKERFQVAHINKYKARSQKDASVEGHWNVLKGALLEATDKRCGWTKRPARDIKKHGGGKMMLAIVVMRSQN